MAELGPIDVWINNAGVSLFARVADVTEAAFERVADVTYTDTVRGRRVALEDVRPRDAGGVVNVCSAQREHAVLQPRHIPHRRAAAIATAALPARAVADAIHVAATGRRRDVLVGGRTVQAALLNAVSPSLADWLPSRFGPRLQISHDQGIAAARSIVKRCRSALRSGPTGIRAWSARP